MMKGLLFLAPLVLAGCVFYDQPVGWVPARDPLTPERIIELKREGQTDSNIRRLLEYHGVAYKVNADDLIAIKQAGAGDPLLSAVATAPVRRPQEARPIYDSGPRHYYHGPPAYSYWGPPLYFAAGAAFGYYWGPYWGRCYW